MAYLVLHFNLASFSFYFFNKNKIGIGVCVIRTFFFLSLCRCASKKSIDHGEAHVLVSFY